MLGRSDYHLLPDLDLFEWDFLIRWYCFFSTDEAASLLLHYTRVNPGQRWDARFEDALGLWRSREDGFHSWCVRSG